MEEGKTHVVYILECSDGTYYTGYTNNLRKRMMAHKSGKAAKYTRGRTPVQLKYARIYESKSEALRAEYDMKQLTRKQKQQMIRETSLPFSELLQSKER